LKKGKFFIQTFGCQMNDHDSEAMAGIMRGAGYDEAARPADADVILVNTCAIREKAEQKAYSQIGRYKQLKAKRPGMVIGVGGCMAQSAGEGVLSRVPYVDFVFGTQAMHRILEMVDEVKEKRRQPVWIGMGEDPSTMEKLYAHSSSQDGLKAFVTVMQGCDNYCAYCIVPYVRGRELSRPSEDIVSEVRRHVAGGVREVTLLGQNVNSYGLKGGDGADFSELIRKVSEVEGLKRIRFTTSHPKDLTDELISLFNSVDKVMPHIHLPLQSGSNAILAAMNRRYTVERYLSLIDKLRGEVPEIAITSDVIVGFPGEGEEEFRATLDVMERVRFDGLFSFKFSPREGTRAAKMEDALPEEVKEARLAILQDLQREHTLERNELWVGRVRPTLVEGSSKSGGGQLMGRTPENKIVNFHGDKSLIGEVVEVRVTRGGINSMVGELA